MLQQRLQMRRWQTQVCLRLHHGQQTIAAKAVMP
jgi:hypothetical protein